VVSIKLQQSGDSDADPDGWSDVVGSSQTVADDQDNKVFYIDFRNSNKRYVKVLVSRATQAATCSAIYYQYGANETPVTHATGVTGESFNGAIEGTA
jgi:hypothetical protein